MAKGKKVSSFTNAEEDAVSHRDVAPFTNEDKHKATGAAFVDGGVFQRQVSVNESSITGQNPPSAEATALAVIKATKA